MPVVVALKLAANGSLTGTITGPPRAGDIKSGSFDPRTGALKFEGSCGVTRPPGRLKARYRATPPGQVTVDGQPGDFGWS